MAIKVNTQVNWSNYKSARNNCNNIIKRTKSKYYRNIFRQNIGNSKVIWKTINELMSRNLSSKSGEISGLKIGDDTINNPAEISELLNKHFSEIGVKLSSTQPESTKSYNHYLKPAGFDFEISNIEKDTVFRLLSNMSETKAVGIDGLSSKLFKLAAPAIAESLRLYLIVL